MFQRVEMLLMTCPSSISCRSGDLTHSRVRWMVWGLPGLLVVVGLLWPASRVWLWTPSFVVMGAACIANAARCRRLHCYITGPLFLLAAAATLLGGLGLRTVPASLTLAIVAAGTAVGYGLEWARGKYIGAERVSGRTIS